MAKVCVGTSIIVFWRTAIDRILDQTSTDGRICHRPGTEAAREIGLGL